MTAAEGIRLAGLHPATLPLVMLPLIRARVAHQSCRQPCGQLPFPRVFPSHSQQTNCCGRTAQPSYSLTPRLNPHSLRHSRRTTRHRDFVLWRFLAAGRQSAWSDHRCRQPKTCTMHNTGCEQVQQKSSYSMTSSARASSVAGTSRPIALAAFKLITSSYFTGA